MERDARDAAEKFADTRPLERETERSHFAAQSTAMSILRELRLDVEEREKRLLALTDALRRAGRDDETNAADGAELDAELDAEAAARREQEATFLVPGVARALAAVFKLGTRGALLAVAERAWGDARDLAASPEASGSALVRQLACKLAQRIGLLFLQRAVYSHELTCS